MAVARLEISSFRCIEEALIELDPGASLISGANGAGKTSILEAVHVLGRGHSFRVRDNRRLIRRGSDRFVVRAVFAPGERARKVSVGYARGDLDVRIDGEAGRRASQLAETLPVEVIDVAAHRLIDGGPGERRRFVDWALFHVEHDYVSLWRGFRRVLVQRNEGLRRGIGDRELEIWDEAFVSAAVGLDRARERFVERWGERARRLARTLLGVEMAVSYRAGLGSHADLAAALRESRERDRERGQTAVGPHRADVTIRFDGGVAREVASRGQQKLLAAALILARLQDRIAHERRGGMLLVDDPAAELDRNALGRLVEVLNELPVQMLVTALDPAALHALAANRLFHVEQGVIRPG